MDISYYLVALGFFEVIYGHTFDLGGLNQAQARVFITSYLVLDAITMVLFANNLWWFPYAVNKGELDIYLTRPVSTLFFITLRDFSPNSMVNALISFFLLAAALIALPQSPGIHRLLTFGLLLLNGIILFNALHFFCLLFVFWLQSPEGLADLFWGIEKVGERPDGVYSGPIKKIFTYFFPLCLVCSVPTRVLFQEDWQQLTWVILLVSIVFYLTTLFFWNYALKTYSSASS